MPDMFKMTVENRGGENMENNADNCTVGFEAI